MYFIRSQLQPVTSWESKMFDIIIESELFHFINNIIYGLYGLCLDQTDDSAVT